MAHLCNTEFMPYQVGVFIDHIKRHTPEEEQEGMKSAECYRCHAGVIYGLGEYLMFLG